MSDAVKSKSYGEIVYTREDGLSVHSDFHTGQGREYMHQLLDEWLDRSGGSGWFFVGDAEEIAKA